jgi:hypothetical protein
MRERLGSPSSMPATMSSSTSTTTTDGEHSRLAKRHYVVRELIDTEAIFVRDMSLARDVYEKTRPFSREASPRFRAWLEECREAVAMPIAAFNLDLFLIKPPQTITKYPALLLAHFNSTPADVLDLKALTEARKANAYYFLPGSHVIVGSGTQWRGKGYI